MVELPILTVAEALAGGLVVGAVGGGVAGAIAGRHSKKSRRRKTRSHKNSRKRVSRSNKRTKGRYTPHTAGKGQDRSHRRIRYTKKGQPYIIMGSGKARFIKKSGARRSHKQKGGRY